MAGIIDTAMAERQVGKDAAKQVQAAIVGQIRAKLKKQSGAAQKTRVSAKFKQNRLDRLTITSPRHVFIQNFGFEGPKTNGVMMRLQAKEVISNALNQGNILENLADNLSELRAEQVIAQINLGNNGR